MRCLQNLVKNKEKKKPKNPVQSKKASKLVHVKVNHVLDINLPVVFTNQKQHTSKQ